MTGSARSFMVLSGRRCDEDISHDGSRGVMPLLFILWAMLIIQHYRAEEGPSGLKEIHSLERACCPDCGGPMSGYDRRRRSLIGDDGQTIIYLLRRLRCCQCGRLHLELPDMMKPQKHYAADLIARTVAGAVDYCPADGSTIRRWKK